jgi:hypothetical protein
MNEIEKQIKDEIRRAELINKVKEEQKQIDKKKSEK